MPGRPFDHRTPSDDVKERFKADLGQKIASAASKGPVFWIDESRFTIKTKLGRAWLVRGLSRMRKIKPYYKRRICFATTGRAV